MGREVRPHTSIWPTGTKLNCCFGSSWLSSHSSMTQVRWRVISNGWGSLLNLRQEVREERA